MNFPPFPSQSLYGSFPSFPVSYVDIPNIADLPGYIYAVTTYYGDVLNYPYSNPPTISYWRIPYPNLLGLPGWIGGIFAYFIGWVAAFFLWVVQVLVIIVSVPIDYLLNLVSDVINWTIQDIEGVASRAGIFGPVVAALLMGMILVAIVAGAFAIFNLVKTLGSAVE